MVANHSQKKQARALMEEFGDRITFTQAMARVEEIRSWGQGARSIFTMDSHRSTMERIGQEIRSGRDVLIFGGVGEGKSTALWKLIHWANLKTLLLTGSSLEAVYAQSLLADSDCEARSAQRGLPDGQLSELKLVAFDELRNDIDWPSLEGFSGSRLAAINSSNPREALWRLDNIFGALGFTDPLVVETKRLRNPDGRGYGIDVAVRNF